MRGGRRRLGDCFAVFGIDDLDIISAGENHLVPMHNACDIVVFELWRRRRQKRATAKERRRQQECRQDNHDCRKCFLHITIIPYRARVGKCAPYSRYAHVLSKKYGRRAPSAEFNLFARLAVRFARIVRAIAARRNLRRPRAKKSIPLLPKAWAESAYLRRRIAEICGTPP